MTHDEHLGPITTAAGAIGAASLELPPPAPAVPISKPATLPPPGVPSPDDVGEPIDRSAGQVLE